MLQNSEKLYSNFTFSSCGESETVLDSFVSCNSSENLNLNAKLFYEKVIPHWFYCLVDNKTWLPLSRQDSESIEKAFLLKSSNIVSIEGSRYDANIAERKKYSVYWKEKPSSICRASWFYKLFFSNAYIPFDENIANELEEEYKKCFELNQWSKKINIKANGIVYMNGPLLLFYQPCAKLSDKELGSTDAPDLSLKLLPIRRGTYDVCIKEGENPKIDHLLLVVHGIGSVCDMKFRSIIECVNDFRELAYSILQSHFHADIEAGRINRVEILPISWHSHLHGETTGLDAKLRNITLHSIPKLRNFTNDTLLDILFYASPFYCQHIIDINVEKLNQTFQLFSERNPYFSGSVSVIGHSLGSLILFDILAHQPINVKERSERNSLLISSNFPAKPFLDQFENIEDLLQSINAADFIEIFQNERITLENLPLCTENDFCNLGLPLACRKQLLLLLHKNIQNKIEISDSKYCDILHAKGDFQSFGYDSYLAEEKKDYNIRYPALKFYPSSFFALGSPVGLFTLLRGINILGEDYKLPTCPAMFNIFHPYDPVAYRLEPFINPLLINIKPYLIPHHKGRKRIHLEFKDIMQKMTSEIRSKFVESLKTTWNSFSKLILFSKNTDLDLNDISSQLLEGKFNKVIEKEFEFAFEDENLGTKDANVLEIRGLLNKQRRIDYVLQESPIESFNEYLFAITSHLCYWESEDTMLLILKEIYDGFECYSNNENLSDIQNENVMSSDNLLNVNLESG